MNTHIGFLEDNYDVLYQFNIEFPLNLSGANDGCLVTVDNGSRNLSFARDVLLSDTLESHWNHPFLLGSILILT